MPFAQYHYPFENKELFEKQFPADFISEAVDQTRGWFYSLLAESASDRMHMAALAFPNIKRSPPITVTGNSPILDIFQPISKTALSNAFWNPVNCIIIFKIQGKEIL